MSQPAQQPEEKVKPVDPNKIIELNKKIAELKKKIQLAGRLNFSYIFKFIVLQV